MWKPIFIFHFITHLKARAKDDGTWEKCYRRRRRFANLFLFSIGKSAYAYSDMLNIFHISP